MSHDAERFTDQSLPRFLRWRKIWGERRFEMESRCESGKVQYNVANHLMSFFVHWDDEILADILKA